MKKFAFALIFGLLSGTVAFAQYQPEKGDFTTEIQFNPFAQNSQNFSLDGLRLRYFLSNNHAVRLNLGFGLASNKHSSSSIDETIDRKSKKGSFDMEIGYEYHINVAPRLSVYAGAETGFSVLSAKTVISEDYKDYYSEKTTIKNAYGSNMAESPNTVTTTGGASYNLKALVGLDFYIYKGLYAGTEFGLQLITSKLNPRETEYVKYDYTTQVTTSSDPADSSDIKNSSVSLAFKAIPAIRLGWKF